MFLMLTQELLVDIHVRHQQGESIRSIAKALNISRNTVRKYFRDAIKVPTYSERAPKLSKLEPFKPPVCQPKHEPTDFEITYKSGCLGERNAKANHSS